MREQVDELFYELILLTTEPDAAAEQLDMWKLLKNLDWKVFEHFWARVTPEQPQLKFHQRYLDQGTTAGGGNWKGLRSKLTNEFDGP